VARERAPPLRSGAGWKISQNYCKESGSSERTSCSSSVSGFLEIRGFLAGWFYRKRACEQENPSQFIDILVGQGPVSLYPFSKIPQAEHTIPASIRVNGIFSCFNFSG
jgi:hypothetical protein